MSTPAGPPAVALREAGARDELQGDEPVTVEPRGALL